MKQNNVAFEIFKKDAIGFIKNNTTNTDIISLIEDDLKNRLYYYGSHFNSDVVENFNLNLIKKITFFIKCSLILSHNIISNLLFRKKYFKKKGLSTATFTYDDITEKSLSARIDRYFTSPKKFKSSLSKLSLHIECLYIEYDLNFKSFNYLLSDEFASKVRSYKSNLKKYIKDNSYEFLFVPGDSDFHNRILINIFKEINKPSICLAHGGMPSIYDQSRESLTDFVSMWGQKQVEAYIENGYDKKRFFVTGHPLYENFKTQDLRFSLDNILVLPKSCDGYPANNDTQINNRSETISYIMQIKEVLQTMKVSNARIRFHPSQNIKWYSNFIDNDFFIVDRDSLLKSLSKTTLVIGPVSTVFIDSILNGVNYLIYEPSENGISMFGRKLTQPLDGHDVRVPQAKSQEELALLISERKKISPEVFEEFCEVPFNQSRINNLIK